MTPDKFHNSYIPEPNTGCWLWDRGATPAGYGSIRTKDGHEYAHRYSYRIARGPIPSGMVIRHVCDTPACVNPDHLCVGSHAENMRDMAQRKRGSKLTDADVAAILQDTRHKKEIAKDYGIALSYVYHIKSGIANRLCVKEAARLRR